MPVSSTASARNASASEGSIPWRRPAKSTWARQSSGRPIRAARPATRAKAPPGSGDRSPDGDDPLGDRGARAPVFDGHGSPPHRDQGLPTRPPVATMGEEPIPVARGARFGPLHLADPARPEDALDGAWQIEEEGP